MASKTWLITLKRSTDEYVTIPTEAESYDEAEAIALTTCRDYNANQRTTVVDLLEWESTDDPTDATVFDIIEAEPFDAIVDLGTMPTTEEK